jgi:hypothetical protein
MIKLKIDVMKISKPDMFVGAKGTYLDIVLIENRDGIDQYGNEGMVVQEISKEARESGRKGPIIGNYRIIKSAPKPATTQPPASYTDDHLDDIPF